MSTVGSLLQLLQERGAVRVTPQHALLQDLGELTPEAAAFSVNAPLATARRVFEVLSQLTSERSVVMEALAEEAGVSDFFQASPLYMGVEGALFRLHGLTGEHADLPLRIEALELLAAA